ncbi:MAG: gliding motility-associated C-terminal domain-containing protein [Bacteroidota bacterium]
MILMWIPFLMDAQVPTDTIHFSFLENATSSTTGGDCPQSQIGTCALLVGDRPNQLGAVWIDNSMIDLRECHDFTFCVNVGDKDENGAEGFAMVLHNDPRENDAIGEGGAGIGYRRISPALVVEVDLHQNSIDDTTHHDHMALYVNDELRFGPVTVVANDGIGRQEINLPEHYEKFDIEDGEPHTFRMTWDAQLQLLQVFFDEHLRISYQIDLINTVFGGTAMVQGGMTASTGSNHHSLVRICPLNNPFIPCPSYDDCDSPPFDELYQSGFPEHGHWEVTRGGDYLTQQVNSGPSFIVTPYVLGEVEAEFDVVVLSGAGDDDNIGFVFGLKEPFGRLRQEFDFWLLNWVKGGINNDNHGLSLVRVKASRNPGFGRMESRPGYDIRNLPIDTLDRWEEGRTYHFKLVYTKEHIRIYRDGALVIEETGHCFQPGRFGFYTESQRMVQFSNFELRPIVDFELLTPEVCLYEEAHFQLFNPSCSFNFDSTLIKSVRWDFGDQTLLELDSPGIASINPVHIYKEPGIYEVRMEVETNLSCIESVSKFMHVLPLPDMTIPKDTVLCEGDSLPITLLQANATYLWGDGSTEANRTIVSPGIYQVTVDRSSCLDSAVLEVQYDTVRFTSATSETCHGQFTGEVQLQGDSSYRYALTDFSNNFFAFDGLPSGTYIAEAVDTFHCRWRDTVVVEEAPKPDHAIEPIEVSCHGQGDGQLQLTLFDSHTYFGLSRDQWSRQLDYTDLSPGEYTLYLLDSLRGCQYDTSFFIWEPPDLKLRLPADTTIQLGCQLVIQSDVNTGHSLAYSWTSDGYMSCRDCPHTVVQPLRPTTYSLTVTNEKNCTVTDAMTVSVDTSRSVYFPNAFSPNDDGVNDDYRVYAGVGRKRIKEIQFLEIFSRRGEMVYEATHFQPDDLSVGWNGKFNGKPAAVGVYVYQSVIEYVDGFLEQRKGSITLIR